MKHSERKTNHLPLAFVLIVPIQNLRLEELLQRLLHRATIRNLKTDIHNLIRFIRLRAARQTLHLALHSTAENLLHLSTTTTTTPVNRLRAAAALRPQLLQTKRRIVARIDHIPQELMSVLLTPKLKMLGENLETARDLVRRIDGVIDAERPRYPFLDYAERTISFPLAINK